jgi:hypothetical protein
METGVSARLTPAEGRKFGLLVGGAFVVLGLVFWWRTRTIPAWIALGLGTTLLVAGLLIPGRLGPVYRWWMRLAQVISKVTTPIFMGLVFFLILTPAGLLARLFGHRPLSRDRASGTYWQSRPAEARQGKMDHQF